MRHDELAARLSKLAGELTGGKLVVRVGRLCQRDESTVDLFAPPASGPVCWGPKIRVSTIGRSTDGVRRLEKSLRQAIVGSRWHQPNPTPSNSPPVG